MFIPLHDHILVKPLGRVQSKIIEVVSNEKYSRALVVSIGPGKQKTNAKGVPTGRRKPMDVKPGDWIVYGFDHIFPVYRENGTEYRILQEADICFISDPEFIDAHHALTDEEIDSLIAQHNPKMAKRIEGQTLQSAA